MKNQKTKVNEKRGISTFHPKDRDLHVHYLFPHLYNRANCIHLIGLLQGLNEMIHVKNSQQCLAPSELSIITSYYYYYIFKKGKQERPHAVTARELTRMSVVGLPHLLCRIQQLTQPLGPQFPHLSNGEREDIRYLQRHFQLQFSMILA